MIEKGILNTSLYPWEWDCHSEKEPALRLRQGGILWASHRDAFFDAKRRVKYDRKGKI